MPSRFHPYSTNSTTGSSQDPVATAAKPWGSALRGLVFAVVVIVGGVASLSQPAAADDHPCSGAATQRLAELGVDKDDVKMMRIDGRYQSRGEGSRLVGYDAWVELGSCSQGQLVVAMSRQCRPTTEYTTGSCEVAGVEGQC